MNNKYMKMKGGLGGKVCSCSVREGYGRNEGRGRRKRK